MLDKIFLLVREIFKFKNVKAAPIIPPRIPTNAAGKTAIMLRSILFTTCRVYIILFKPFENYGSKISIK